MQNIPPWDNPATSSYCQAVNSWITLATVLIPASDRAPLSTCIKTQSHSAACQQLFQKYTYSVWSSDTVFCPSLSLNSNWTGDLWQVMLSLALVGWVFLTAVSLLHTYEWRGLSGYSLGELVKTVGRQIALLLAAALSFSLLLAIHQLLFLLINSLLGGLPQWRVDSEWSVLVKLVTESQNATQTLDPNGAVDQFFGGNLPDSSGPFGLSWGQVFGGLGSGETFVASALIPIRFVAMFVAVISAPLAILCYSTSLTRRLFYIWLQFWAEIEGLAVGSAIVLAAYQQLHHHLGNLAPTEQAYILLGLCGLVCGANLAFLWKIIGQFLGNITSFYQQQYQRERQVVGIAAQAVVGILGALATVFTGGAALPVALAAEGLVSGATNLGATPGGGVPGAGVGQAFLGAGRASATSQHQQAQEAEQAERNQRQEDRYQAGQTERATAAQEAQTRQRAQDANRTADRAITKGYASQWPPRPDQGTPGPGAGARTPWGSGGSGGGASPPGPAPHQPMNGPPGPGWGSPVVHPPTVPQQISSLLGPAPIAWEVKRDLAGALRDLYSTRGQPSFEEGARRVQKYLDAAQDQAQVRTAGPGSRSLMDTLSGLMHPAPEEEEDDA